ncbi:MAG: AI-2E family transporter, partial [Gemmatimonadetes bacterium]|nr:AI-2E family transporter [Gemmatimonadota bacterium]
MVSSDGAPGVPPTWRVVQGAVVVLAAGFFLFSLDEILNPFLIYCAFIALLIPFRGIRGHTHMVSVATVLVALWVLHTAGSLLGPFFLAFVLAYILDPVVDRVSAHPRLGRTASIFLILVPFLGIGALVFVVGLPQLVGQARGFIDEAPRFVTEFRGWVQGLTPESLGFDIPLLDEAAMLERVQSLDAQSVGQFLETHRAELADRARTAVLGLGRGFGTLFTIFGFLVLTPVLMFYLLRDFDLIVARGGELVPGKFRSAANRFASDFDRLLSSYLRGQVSAALITGGIT